MMTTTEMYILYPLLICNAWLLGIGCFVMIRFERRCRKVEAFWSSPTGNAISEEDQCDSNELYCLTERLDKRVSDLQKTVKVLEIQSPKPTPPMARTAPIENAIRMARLGASIEDLTRNCGLNIAEARLLRTLHGKAQRSMSSDAA